MGSSSFASSLSRFGIVFSFAIILLASVSYAAPVTTTATITDGLRTPWPCTLGAWCSGIPKAPVGLYVNLSCSGPCGTTYFCQDTMDMCTPNIAYNLSGPFLSGMAFVRFYSVNASGAPDETVQSVMVMIDTSGPTTTASATLANGSSYVFNTTAGQDVTVTLTCTDASSGCSATGYCIDGTNTCTPGTAYTVPVVFPFSSPGTYYIRYNSTDNAGIVEAVKFKTVQLGTAPVTNATAVKSDGSNYVFNTWTNSSYVNVTLSCTDAGGPGCAATLWCSGLYNQPACVPSTPYAGTFTVGSNLLIPAYVAYKSVDLAGLNEVTKVQNILFDRTPPVTTPSAVNASGAVYQFGVKSLSPYINITLACSDPGVTASGCNATLYCIDSMNTCIPNVPYAGPVQMSTLGFLYFRFMSNDTAGNVEAIGFRTTNLGTTPTTIATAVKNDSTNYTFDTWVKSSYVNVTLNCTDVGGPGCNATMYCLDTNNSCNPTLLYSTPVQISTQGVSYIRYLSNDSLGVYEPNKTQTIRIDTIAPAVAIQSPVYTAYFASSLVPLNFTSVDAGSGVNTSACLYKMDAAAPLPIPGCNNMTLPLLPVGWHNLTVYSNDTVNNRGSANVTFLSATINVSVARPQFWTRSTYNSISFNVSFSGFATANCSLWNASGAKVSSIIVYRNGTAYLTAMLSYTSPNGFYPYNVTCSHPAFASFNDTKLVNVSFDNTAPRINFTSAGQWFNHTNVSVSYNVTDNLADKLACTLTYGATRRPANVTNGTAQTENLTLAYQGQSYVQISCTDYAGNLAYGYGTVGLDSVAPVVSLTSILQAPGVNANGTKNMTFYYYIMDTSTMNSTTYTIDSGAINGSLGTTKYGSFKLPLMPGNHTIHFDSFDLVWNYGFLNRNFTVN